MSACFIVGVQRSGTTMLSVMLARHKEIFVEDTVKAFRIVAAFENMNYLQEYNLGLSEKDFQKWIVKNDGSSRLEEVVDNGSIEKASSFREGIGKSIIEKLSSLEKKVWCDKAPNLQHYIAEITLLLPQAKFIHIVRDGRAVASSLNKRGYKNLKLSAQSWVDGNVRGLVNQQILGKDKYLIVKYEDLLLSPEIKMKEVCEFLALSYDPKMIELDDREESSGNYVKNFLDASKIDNWKHSLTAKQIRIIEEIQIKCLEKYSYEVGERSYKPISYGKKLRLKQADNWLNLFRGQKRGMKDKQIVQYNDSFATRLKRFLVLYASFFLSEEITKRLFSRYNYKEKTKSNKFDSP